MMFGKKIAFVTFSTKQSHCFDKDLLKRFIATLSKSDSFDLSGLL